MVNDSIKQRLLEHEVRKAIYERVEERPGITQSQLADELDAYPTQIEYHVDRLVINRLLVDVPHVQGEEAVLFRPPQIEPWTSDEAQLLLGGYRLRTVATYVAAHPGTTADQIAQATDRPRSWLRIPLHALEDQGLAETTGSGARARYYPTDVLKTWIEKVEERSHVQSDET